MKPIVTDVAPMVRAYYARPGNEAGGSLHIVLDDGNVTDADVQFCRDRAVETGDVCGVVLASTLLTMSQTQRRRLAGMRR